MDDVWENKPIVETTNTAKIDPTEGDGAWEQSIDPFAPEHVAGVQLVVSMRIYDVLMALLDKQAPARADALSELHKAGLVLGSPPQLLGFAPES
jgi:hypothetical protein